MHGFILDQITLAANRAFTGMEGCWWNGGMLFPWGTDYRLRSGPLPSPTQLPPRGYANKLDVSRSKPRAETMQPKIPPTVSLVGAGYHQLGPDNTANQHSTTNTSGAMSSHIERIQPEAGLQITLKETTGKLALARCIYSYHNVILLAGAKYILRLKKCSKSFC